MVSTGTVAETRGPAAATEWRAGNSACHECRARRRSARRVMGAMPALRGLAAAVVLVVMGLAANGAAGARADPETVAALRAAAAASGWVRVIVTLAPAGQTLAPIGDRQRKGQIAALQDRVLARLGEHAVPVRKYRALPQLAMRVTPVGLERLLDDPEVVSIHPDRLMAPTGTPRLGAGSPGIAQ